MLKLIKNNNVKMILSNAKIFYQIISMMVNKLSMKIFTLKISYLSFLITVQKVNNKEEA